MGMWLHNRLMTMPAVIKKIKESESGHHHLQPPHHLCLELSVLDIHVRERIRLMRKPVSLTFLGNSFM